MSKPTVKELRQLQANELLGNLCENPLKTAEAESEIANFLKINLRMTQKEIAAFLGITDRQARTRLDTYKLYALEGKIPSLEVKERGFSLGTTVETPHDSVMLDAVEKMNRSTATKITNLVVKGDVLEQRLVAACANHLPRPDELKAVESLYKSAKSNRSKSRSKKEEIAVATMSDLHLALETPQHPYSKALEANSNFVKRVLKLTDLQRQNFIVRHLHLNLDGDMVQGSMANYPAQRWDTTMPAVIQIERMTEVAVRDIETFLVDFDEVTVNCSPGNHGNLLKDGPDPGNWETVMHRSLRWAFRGNKRVHFNIEEDDFYQVVDIMGSKFLLMHGHALKGGNFDGLVMSFRKYADILPEFRYAIIGHFHRFARLPLPRQHGSRQERTLYMNGTAVERDDFIEKMGGSPTPLWWLFFVGDKGITNEYAVRLYD